MRRVPAAIAAVVVLLFGACTGDDGDEETTPQPSEPERVEVLSDFQLVGEIDEAFAGAEPPVDVPDADEAPAPEDEDVTGPTLGPEEEVQFGSTPASGGVMRVVVEDVSEELSTRCGLIADDAVDVYWTTDTSFDPDDVVNDIDGIEDEIEGRVAGVAGRILSEATSKRSGDAEGADAPRPTLSVDTEEDEDTDATGSPDLFDTEDLRTDDDGSDCLLVADQVGFESDRLPTPSQTSRPVAPRVEEPAPTREPEETEEPDEKTPKPTKSPSRTPRETATSTAEED